LLQVHRLNKIVIIIIINNNKKKKNNGRKANPSVGM